MKQKTVPYLLVALLCAVCVTSAIAAESLYVQPFQARVYSKPTLASAPLATVDSGFQFVPIGKEGNWLKLTFNGKPGFIPAVQTAQTPPLGTKSGQKESTAPKLTARTRTSSSATVVAGMKGLTYEDRARMSSSERSDYETLDKIEALTITPDELNQFLLDGGKQ